MAKIIEDASVTEYRKDGFYKVEAGNNVQWLRGTQLTPGSRVGDTGRLEYRSGPASGLYYFVREHEFRLLPFHGDPRINPIFVKASSPIMRLFCKERQRVVNLKIGETGFAIFGYGEALMDLGAVPCDSRGHQYYFVERVR